jgi:hypothetical protein
MPVSAASSARTKNCQYICQSGHGRVCIGSLRGGGASRVARIGDEPGANDQPLTIARQGFRGKVVAVERLVLPTISGDSTLSFNRQIH